MTPILFLDVDGVLRPHKPSGYESGIRIGCCVNLAEVIRATHCRIVLSSAWRYSGWGRHSLFSQCLRGSPCWVSDDDAITVATTPIAETIIASIIGATRLDKSPTEDRHVAILEWVAEHTPTRWVAVDDLDCIADCGEGHYLRTDGKVGLTYEDADKLVEMLGAWK